MEVWDRQQFSLTLGQPLGTGQALALGAVPIAARVVGLPHKAAVGAMFGVTAEGCGPAPLHRRHDTALNAPEMAVMVAAIVRAVAVEDIRHFQIGTHGGRLNRAA